MRLRRGVAVAIASGGGALTTLLAGLVTNVVSEQTWWPGPLAALGAGARLGVGDTGRPRVLQVPGIR
jgi:hypothetical protein